MPNGQQSLQAQNATQYTATRFMAQVPQVDANGERVPVWKRHELAKQLAERTRVEDDERRTVRRHLIPKRCTLILFKIKCCSMNIQCTSIHS